MNHPNDLRKGHQIKSYLSSHPRITARHPNGIMIIFNSALIGSKYKVCVVLVKVAENRILIQKVICGCFISAQRSVFKIIKVTRFKILALKIFLN